MCTFNMGTNYYWTSPGKHDEPCPECGHVRTMPDQRLHIGKSSGGWCFSLRAIPEESICTLADWERVWTKGEIHDEYGAAITPEEMRKIITERKGSAWSAWQPYGYRDEQQFHELNLSQRGPNGLLRHRLGSHCIGHGDGTYDLIVGEFS